MRYLILAGLVLSLNVLPAFAPPTWAVLVFYKLNSTMNTAGIIVVGVLAAASGRYILARVFTQVRKILPPRYLLNVEVAKNYLDNGKRVGVIYLLLFALSPLPSAQLFEAAALAGAELLPITAAFMIGRAFSYSFTVLGASTLKERGLGTALIHSMQSPWGIALQILCLAAIFLMMRVNWSNWGSGRGRKITE
jgi:membrane protein YqaA with SNARE-associated domain